VFQRLDALNDNSAIFLPVLFTKARRERVGRSQLFVSTSVLVEPSSQFPVGEKGQRPIDDSHPVIGLGILQSKRDVFPMEGLRFREFVRIEGLTGHLEEKRSDSIDCRDIARLNPQQFPKLCDRGFTFLPVFLRGSPGNVLRSIGGCEIQPRVNEFGIPLLGVAELLYGFFILAALEGLYALKQRFSRLNLRLRLRIWILPGEVPIGLDKKSSNDASEAGKSAYTQTRTIDMNGSC